jgi:uroporphyrin-III C-methyltransferase
MVKERRTVTIQNICDLKPSQGASGSPHLVSIVGAGPGDLELLTIKAYRRLRSAQVILYDNLVNKEILSIAPAEAQLIYVGKQCGKHEMSQSDINRTLIEYSQTHQNVVRLKGGDPFVFGRGAEEAQALVEAGISFEIVPGISSSIAAAAYAGIPVTHRELASSFAVITGHEDPTKETSSIHWSSLGGIDTLVFLMAVGNRAAIASQLIKSGRHSDEPVAFVESGTTKNQRVTRSTLGEVRDRPPNINSPAVMIVGGVVDLNLSWFLPHGSNSSFLRPSSSIGSGPVEKPVELAR